MYSVLPTTDFMIRYLRISAAIILLFLCHKYAAAQENLFDYANTLKFANFLRTSGQYAFSAEEYERLFFHYPHDSLVAVELARTYRAAGLCDKSRIFFETVRTREFFNTGPFLKEYLHYALQCDLHKESYFKYTAGLPKEEKSFYELGYFWMSKNKKEAFAYNRNHLDILKEQYPDLHSLTTKFESEKYKKPALAALMSAILPGSGKAYAGRWEDGLISFLFVGTNAYAAYRAFNKKGVESANGWIFGSIAFSFYSANIWGSAKAAGNYNKNLEDKYYRNAEIIIHNHNKPDF